MTFAADLELMLRLHGQDVILRRTVGTTNQTSVDCTCRAMVRGYKPDQLSDSIMQGDTQVIISATDINRTQWPGGLPITSPPATTDPRIPRSGGSDKVVIEGRARTIMAAEPIYIAGDLVRINLQVRG